MRFGIALLVALFVLASGVWAGSVAVTVADPSFESCSGGNPAGWTSWNAGCFSPSAGQFNQAVPNGSYVLWANLQNNPSLGGNGDDGFAYQVLASTLLSNTTYTLTIDVGMQATDTMGPGAIVELRAGTPTTGNTPGTGGLTGTTLLSEVLSNGSNGPTDGYFGVWTLTYDSGASNSNAGQPLEIYLSSSTIQSDYDSVSLSYNADPPTSNPEPAMFALVGAGLLGLVARRRFAK
jgi:MYXO-CTERM domain-containing protein